MNDRRLNGVTEVVDPYPMSRADDLLEKLSGGAKYLTA